MKIKMYSQPDNTSCGPTCLHAVYRHWEDSISLEKVIREVQQFEKGGGTLAVILAKHALQRGYRARLYSYNLNIFDPSWFSLNRDELITKLKKQLKFKRAGKKFEVASKAYIQFLKMKGEILFSEKTTEVIKRELRKGHPILAGLSSTWLYQSKREHSVTNKSDDLKGRPTGHFIIICGYNSKKNCVKIADPYIPNPIGPSHFYEVPLERFMASLFLGVLTYDANLLVLERRRK